MIESHCPAHYKSLGNPPFEYVNKKWRERIIVCTLSCDGSNLSRDSLLVKDALWQIHCGQNRTVAINILPAAQTLT